MEPSSTTEEDDGAASSKDLAKLQIQRIGVGDDGVRAIIDEIDEDKSESDDGEYETEEEEQSAATRTWKNSLCRCNPSSFFWSLLCFTYVLGDVQTRAHITICGNRSTGQPIYGFGVIGVIVLVAIYMAIITVLLVIINYYERVYNSYQPEYNAYRHRPVRYDDDDYGVGEDEAKKTAELFEMLLPLVNVVALAITLLTTLTIISKTRRTIRNNSNIPGGFCKDLFLSTFCMVCVLAQMDSHVSDQIEITRSENWKQQELELQNKRKEEDTDFEPEDTCERGRAGLKVCKWMVFLFVVTLISLAVIGFGGEDELYFAYSMKIFGVLLAIMALVFSFAWGIKRCLKRRSHIGHHAQELELGNDVSESFQNDVGHMCENEIV